MRMYVCIGMYRCVCMYVCVYVQVGSNMTRTNCDLFTYKSVPIIFEPPCIYMYCVSMYVCICVCVYVYMYMCMYIYICIYRRVKC